MKNEKGNQNKCRSIRISILNSFTSKNVEINSVAPNIASKDNWENWDSNRL